MNYTVGVVAAILVMTASCQGADGPEGAPGRPGPQGPMGAPGQDAPGPAFPEAAGSRLAPVFFAAADGTRIRHPTLWFDTLRAERCSFVEMRDGLPRCLPAHDYMKLGWFADASCTVPATMRALCDPPTDYTRDRTGISVDGCGPLGFGALRALGERLPDGAVLYLDTGSACVAQPTALGTTNVGWLVGAEVPMSEFVSGATE